MSITERAKEIAGRWLDARREPLHDEAQYLAPAPFDIESRDDGTGTWLPAGLVDVHDEVNVAGRWFTVTGTDVRVPSGSQPGFATLEFGGWSHRSGFGSRVYVRDIAVRIGDELKAVHGGR